MDFILPSYQVNEPTWFYLSFLLIVAVFYRFNRVWSLRNLDLALLLSIAPALLFIAPDKPSSGGYVWLFGATGCLLLRVICDALFTRRPRLPQNMNTAGLAFLCIAAGLFLTLKIIAEPPVSSVSEARRARELLAGEPTVTPTYATYEQSGPGARLIYAAVAIAELNTMPELPSEKHPGSRSERIVACTTAILAHLAVVLGLLFIAHVHFGDLQTGLAMATLYLLLPCTAYDVGRVNHVLPAALVLWAFATYRQAWLAGMFLGLACGTLFFPVFLVPLWLAFYGRRGGWQFALAWTTVAAVLIGGFALSTPDMATAVRQVIGEVDWSRLQFQEVEAAGFWSIYPGVYRIPVFFSFLVLLVAVTIWPRRKNLAHLIAHSTAIVIAAQFWYPQQGGVYVLWYLPLLLLVVFRPPLDQHLPPVPLGLFRTKEEPTPRRELVAAGTGHLYR